MPPEPHWTAYVSAFLTPVVALLAIWIARQQWCTARDKLKLDLFDRRLTVYQAATAFIASVMTTGKVIEEDRIRFLRVTRDAKWLVGSEIAEYLDNEIHRKALDLQCLDTELEGVPVSKERSDNVQKQTAIKLWFNEQFGVLDKKFSSFLELKH